MYIIASIAISQNGYIDDSSDQRLILSSEEDLHAIHELRASCDAILIGANTVRRDNPSLTARSDPPSYPTKVTITKSGDLPLTSNFFTSGPAQKLIYAPQSVHDKIIAENTELINLAEMDLKDILADLKQRGFKRLLIEGGATIMNAVIEENLIDELRLAVAPITVDDGIYFMSGSELEDRIKDHLALDHLMLLSDTEVRYYKNHNKWMELAVELSQKSPAQDRYKVGAVIIDVDNNIITTGYTEEIDDSCHAEEVAIAKAKDQGIDLTGATIYTTMEPCSKRASRPKTCTELILEAGIKQVIFAYHEPDILVENCESIAILEQAGLHIIELPAYADKVAQINDHIIQSKNKLCCCC